MSKRKRFIVSTLVLTLVFALIQALEGPYKFFGIFGMSLLTLPLVIWSLSEGIGLNLTLVTIILPFMFTLSTGLFWFLLPTSLVLSLMIFVFYSVGMYVIFLVSNIYSVGAIKTIPLVRSARGVGFVASLIIMFLLFNFIWSLRAEIYMVVPIIFLVTFPLFLEIYWTASPEISLDSRVVKYSLSSSLIISELSLALYFWPVTVTIGSLFQVIASYVLLGLGQADIEGRLFSQTISEYLKVAAIVGVGMFLATRWHGYF